MEYVYAALMLHKLKKEITEENVTSIVKASGAELNEAKVKSLVASLADVDIEEAIKAAPIAAAAPAAAPAAEGGEGKKAEKKKQQWKAFHPYSVKFYNIIKSRSILSSMLFTRSLM